MRKPKITIVTITFNSEKTVRNTFDSIRKQKYENLEYLVIDGGSKDSTLKIAEEYRDIITRIISEPDEGISDAMNKGIRYATGELIGIIHSDDMLADNALNILSSEWDSKHDVYYGHSIVCSEEGVNLHILRAKQDLSGMKYGLVLVHPSTFVTKDAYTRFGVFDKNYKCSMDYELLLRFYKSGAKFKFIDQPLAVYRVGGTNMKYRKKTINEVKEVSIKYGASPIKANGIKLKKIAVDKVRPLFNKLHIKNHRVEKI